MKKLLVLFLFTVVISSRIEAATDFTVSLSGDPIYYGQGNFSLSGNSLSYTLRTDPYGFSRAEIRGPAGPSDTAPLLYNLSLITCIAPIDTERGYCRFEGLLNISDSEAIDLQNGLWYVKSFVGGSSGNRFIRGQITAVPEPSAWMLAVLAAGVGLLLCQRKGEQAR